MSTVFYARRSLIKSTLAVTQRIRRRSPNSRIWCRNRWIPSEFIHFNHSKESYKHPVMAYWKNPPGSHPRHGSGRPRETGASRNASPAQEADWSVPDDEEQPLSCETSHLLLRNLLIHQQYFNLPNYFQPQ